MSVATSTAIAIGAGVAAAGSIGGAIVSSDAAGKAASTQSSAADYAANLQKEEADKALAFQEKEWNTQQSNLEPWLTSGKQALGDLTGLLSTPGKGLLEPFTPPTLDQAKQEPGYQFAEQQGEGAMQNSQAAKGNLISGNAMEALDKFGQNFAETDYNNVYNRSLSTFENNNTNTFNRLAALAGVGQQAGTTLGQEGQAASSNLGNILMTTGAQQGQDAQNAAAATASGYVGSANAWGSALGGMTNNLSQLAMMNQLFGKGGTSPMTADPTSSLFANYDPNLWVQGG